MSEETPLQIEMTSSGKASEKQSVPVWLSCQVLGNLPEGHFIRTDPACEGLHEDIDKRKKLIQQLELICFQYCCRSCSWKVIITFFIVLLAVFFLIFMTVKLPGGKGTEQLGHKLMSQWGSPCPRFWIGYEGKCYFFSRENQDWTSSDHHCSSHNATLARTEKEEMDFVMRLKGKDIYWIGLRRVLSKDWTWTDGEKATMEVIGGGGGCAFLDDTGKAIASGCHTKLHWICTKPALYI
ncbi:C-type lectin domain family 2 member B-like isoform X1 [Paroedura picta]|uniref:C-type lectin domain family 2 member B-like isoform X1 n=1 Tax=Paroedura picta TaxID=143630 RepID=UPI004056F9F3